MQINVNHIGGVMVSVLTLSMVDRGFIGGVMVSMLTLSVVDRGFKPLTGQTKDYKIGICCFSSKYVALRSKIKDWLIQNQDNVSCVKWHVYREIVISVS